MNESRYRMIGRYIQTKLNFLRCARPWLWLENLLGIEPFRTTLLSPVEVANYNSYGENKRTPGCQCRPTNVLYWELSEANTDGCPVHGESEPLNSLEPDPVKKKVPCGGCGGKGYPQPARFETKKPCIYCEGSGWDDYQERKNNGQNTLAT